MISGWGDEGGGGRGDSAPATSRLGLLSAGKVRGDPPPACREVSKATEPWASLGRGPWERGPFAEVWIFTPGALMEAPAAQEGHFASGWSSFPHPLLPPHPSRPSAQEPRRPPRASWTPLRSGRLSSPAPRALCPLAPAQC
jgi:hypothetical protein